MRPLIATVSKWVSGEGAAARAVRVWQTNSRDVWYAELFVLLPVVRASLGLLSRLPNPETNWPPTRAPAGQGWVGAPT